MFFPNLDGDIVDIFCRREDGCHGTAQKVGSSAAGLLAFGWWQRRCTARASCLLRSFVGRHFFEEGVWSWFWSSGLTFCSKFAKKLGEDEGTWVALKGSKSTVEEIDLVKRFNNRLLLLQLRV